MYNNDYLDRIADALEKRYAVDPKLIVGGVLRTNLYRIADVLDPNPKQLDNGSVKNPLARIAEALEQWQPENAILYLDDTDDIQNYVDYNKYAILVKENRVYALTAGKFTYLGFDIKPEQIKIPSEGLLPNYWFHSDKAGEIVVWDNRGFQNNIDGNNMLVVPVNGGSTYYSFFCFSRTTQTAGETFTNLGATESQSSKIVVYANDSLIYEYPANSNMCIEMTGWYPRNPYAEIDVQLLDKSESKHYKFTSYPENTITLDTASGGVKTITLREPSLIEEFTNFMEIE